MDSYVLTTTIEQVYLLFDMLPCLELAQKFKHFH